LAYAELVEHVPEPAERVERCALRQTEALRRAVRHPRARAPGR
jgi:hypothetical protein